VFLHRPTFRFKISPLVGVPPPTNTCTFFSFGWCSATDQPFWLKFPSPLVGFPPPTNLQVQNSLFLVQYLKKHHQKFIPFPNYNSLQHSYF
jgi:hypothetical protein